MGELEWATLHARAIINGAVNFCEQHGEPQRCEEMKSWWIRVDDRNTAALVLGNDGCWPDPLRDGASIGLAGLLMIAEDGLPMFVVQFDDTHLNVVWWWEGDWEQVWTGGIFDPFGELEEG